jgi:hypothetical protein
MIMDNAVDPTIRGTLTKTADNVKTFMAKIEEHFRSSSKANTNILISKLMQTKYDGRGNIREHVLNACISLKATADVLPDVCTRTVSVQASRKDRFRLTTDAISRNTFDYVYDRRTYSL